MDISSVDNLTRGGSGVEKSAFSLFSSTHLRNNLGVKSIQGQLNINPLIRQNWSQLCYGRPPSIGCEIEIMIHIIPPLFIRFANIQVYGFAV